MNKKTLISLSLLLFVLIVNAQDQRGDWQAERNRRIHIFIDSLKLDSLQTILFTNVQQQYFSQLEALREKYPGQREKIMDERRRFAEARDLELKGILSEEQWLKYEALLVSQREKRGRSRPD